MEEDLILEDLVLLLLYIYSWNENVAGKLCVTRSWKGYDFDTLDSLSMKGYIGSSCKAKSVIITEDGLERARSFKKMLFNEMDRLYGSA